MARKDNLDAIVSPASRAVIKDNFDYVCDQIDGVESTLQAQVTNNKAEYDAHTGGTGDRHTASMIDNNSAVVGANVANALDTLQAVVSNIEATDSNAQIGIYPVNASGTDTLTGTYVGVTYYGGLKILLKCANSNTGAVTFNLNSLGEKSIKVFKRDGTKSDIASGDLWNGKEILLKYDGTDFIWVGGENASDESSISSYANVLAFPSSAQTAPADVVLKGHTATNNVADDGFSGWSLSNCNITSDSTTGVYGDSTKITLTGTVADVYSLIGNKPKMRTNGYYFASAWVKNGNVTNGIQISKDNITGGIVVGSGYYTGTSWKRIGFKVQPSDMTAGNSFEILVFGSSGQYAWIDGLSVVEISASDYALSISELMGKYPYINGTQGAMPGSVVTTGKNLFDNNVSDISQNTANVRLYTSSGKIHYVATSAPTITNKRLLRLIPNTTYTMKISNLTGNNGGGNACLVNAYVESTAQNYYAGATQTTGVAITTGDSGNVYIGLITQGNSEACDVSFNFQLELGATATTYEPYTETSASLPYTLYGLPNGVADEWHARDGYITWNIREYTLTAGDITGYTTSGTNNDYVVVSKKTDCATYNNGATTVSAAQAFYVPGFIAGTYSDTTAAIGFLTNSSNGTSIILVVAKGTYANLAAAQAALAGTKTYYQLATPIITEIDPIVLNSHPSGQIVIEPIISKEQVYTSSFVVNSTYKLSSTAASTSIKSLNKITLSSVDGSRLRTPIDLSTVTIAGDRLSFTSTALSSGDLVECDYYYGDGLGLNPLTTVTFSNNLSTTVKDLVNQVGELDKNLDNLADFSTAMFLQLVGMPQRLSYQVEDLAADADISNRILLDIPAGYAFTLTNAKIISNGTPSGIDNSNTVVVTLTDGTNTIVTKTYNGTTLFPTNAVDDLGTLNATYKVLSGSETLKLSVTCGTTANLPSFTLQVYYTVVKIGT